MIDMNPNIIKLLTAFFNSCGLNSTIFKPAGIRLTSLSLVDYMEDEELKALFYNKNVIKTVNNIKVLGIPTQHQINEFINSPEARVIIQYIIENSNAEEPYDYYITSYKQNNG